MSRSLVVVLPALLLAACVTGPAGVDSSPDLARSSHAAARYFTVAADPRDCMWPACGGYVLTPVNRSTFTCPDGTVGSSCYVAEIDTSGLFSSASASADATSTDEKTYDEVLGDGRLLLRGTLSLGSYSSGDYGVLTASEAWAGETGTAPTGAFVRVTDSGRECAKCEYLDEKKLNRPGKATIADLDFTASGATADQVKEAWTAVEEPDGLIVAGARYDASGMAGRTVTEAYVLFAAE